MRRCIRQSANPLQKTWRLSDWLLWLLYLLCYWYCLTSCGFMKICAVTNTHAQSLVQVWHSVGLVFSTCISQCMIYHSTRVELLIVPIVSITTIIMLVGIYSGIFGTVLHSYYCCLTINALTSFVTIMIKCCRFNSQQTLLYCLVFRYKKLRYILQTNCSPRCALFLPIYSYAWP